MMGNHPQMFSLGIKPAAQTISVWPIIHGQVQHELAIDQWPGINRKFRRTVVCLVTCYTMTVLAKGTHC